jgi:hypothetical protein
LLTLDRWSSLLHPPAAILYLGCDNDYDDDLEYKRGHRHLITVMDSPHWGRMLPLAQWFNDLQIRLRIKTILAREKRPRVQTAASSQTGEMENAPSVAELEAPVLDKMLAYAQEHKALLVVG